MTARARVQRRFLHWRPRWRGPKVDLFDPDVDTSGTGGGGFSLLDFLDDLFAAVLVMVAIALLVMAVVPTVVIVLEVLLVAVVAALGLAGRVLFGRPWTIEARDVDTDRVLGRWQVVGFRRAGAVAAAIEEHLAAGGDPPSDEAIATLLDPVDARPSWPTS